MSHRQEGNIEPAKRSQQHAEAFEFDYSVDHWASLHARLRANRKCLDALYAKITDEFKDADEESEEGAHNAFGTAAVRVDDEQSREKEDKDEPFESKQAVVPEPQGGEQQAEAEPQAGFPSSSSINNPLGSPPGIPAASSSSSPPSRWTHAARHALREEISVAAQAVKARVVMVLYPALSLTHSALLSATDSVHLAALDNEQCDLVAHVLNLSRDSSQRSRPPSPTSPRSVLLGLDADDTDDGNTGLTSSAASFAENSLSANAKSSIGISAATCRRGSRNSNEEGKGGTGCVLPSKRPFQGKALPRVFLAITALLPL